MSTCGTCSLRELQTWLSVSTYRQLPQTGAVSSHVNNGLQSPVVMQTNVLKISGMTCGGCIGKVAHALEAVAGVGNVEISLRHGQATVEFDDRQTSPEHLRSAVQHSGYAADFAAAHHAS